MTEGVALAHDYITQIGGAERVALVMAEAFPGSPMYTTLYDPPSTYSEFADLDIRASALNRIGPLRRHHRLALPLLAPAVDRQRVDAEVLLASSTGWAHAYRGAARTVVYCNAPARWLYQRERYLGPKEGGLAHRSRRALAAGALAALSPALRRWDADAAHRADRYLTNSTVTRAAILEVYGIEAEILPPPPALLSGGEERPIADVEPGFLLCVARLLPYKNIDVVIEAAQRAGRALVVVGEGPDRDRLAQLAARTTSTHLVGRISDDELRWVYRNASMLVAASYEDFGLTPLEAAAFGRPTVAFRGFGYLDTVREGVTGEFFDAPLPGPIAEAVERVASRPWDEQVLVEHADSFGPERFKSRLQQVVSEVLRGGANPLPTEG